MMTTNLLINNYNDTGLGITKRLMPNDEYNYTGYLSLCRRTQVGTNENIKYQSIVKKDYKKNVFSFGLNNNIACIQNTYGKTYKTMMNDENLSGEFYYNGVFTIISDQPNKISNSDKLYKFYFNLDRSNNNSRLYSGNSAKYTGKTVITKTVSNNVYQQYFSRSQGNDAEYTKYMPVQNDIMNNDYQHLDLGQDVYILSGNSSMYTGYVYFLKYQKDSEFSFRSFNSKNNLMFTKTFEYQYYGQIYPVTYANYIQPPSRLGNWYITFDQQKQKYIIDFDRHQYNTGGGGDTSSISVGHWEQESRRFYFWNEI